MKLKIYKSGQEIYSAKYEYFGLLEALFDLAIIIPLAIFLVGLRTYRPAKSEDLVIIFGGLILGIVVLAAIPWLLENIFSRVSFDIEDIKKQGLEYYFTKDPFRRSWPERVKLNIMRKTIYMQPSEFDRFRSFLESEGIKFSH